MWRNCNNSVELFIFGQLLRKQQYFATEHQPIFQLCRCHFCSTSALQIKTNLVLDSARAQAGTEWTLKVGEFILDCHFFTGQWTGQKLILQTRGCYYVIQFAQFAWDSNATNLSSKTNISSFIPAATFLWILRVFFGGVNKLKSTFCEFHLLSIACNKFPGKNNMHRFWKGRQSQRQRWIEMELGMAERL